MLEPPIITRARLHGGRTALLEGTRASTYNGLLDASARVASALLGESADLDEARIGFMAPAGSDYVAAQWGIWRAGGIAVPLSVHATLAELEHVVADSGVERILTTAGHCECLKPLGRELQVIDGSKDLTKSGFPEIHPQRRAMILYTSGTTNKPKGVVSTHANLSAQMETLVKAWEWSADDRIPLFLPLHHIHGIVNVLGCALWSGATVDAFPRFEAEVVLPRVAAGDYSLFMAVPTIYAKLAAQFEKSPSEFKAVMEGFARMRLMVSGSAALPAGLHRKWAELTGQILLERYGMTETGMILSNPLHGERRPGAVGQPLPGVELRLKNEVCGHVIGEGEPGEVQVRGAAVFQEYWGLPAATEESFEDGWFRTGDVAVHERGYYRILGRMSVDIIKSGGYKLSALEIETALLDHPAIRECAVVGLADDTWGEIVAVAAVIENDRDPLALDGLQKWSQDRLSSYKLPRRLLLVNGLPRNAMGKVAKREVVRLFDQPAGL